jgi:hypothetical protein
MVWARAVPGHGVIIPVGAADTGGPRGSIPLWKVSMMIMRPPQQGHGGRRSGGSPWSTGSAGLVGGGTASSCRTRAAALSA